MWTQKKHCLRLIHLDTSIHLHPQIDKEKYTSEKKNRQGEKKPKITPPPFLQIEWKNQKWKINPNKSKSLTSPWSLPWTSVPSCCYALPYYYTVRTHVSLVAYIVHSHSSQDNRPFLGHPIAFNPSVAKKYGLDFVPSSQVWQQNVD